MESSSGSIIVSKGMQNPFTLKVGQVFTGFGVGCGLGIGVGRPINLGAIPVLNQVMVAARGASDVFSGVGRHVNHSLKKVGARNIEAGIGCGVGFGHGFGVGIAIKPGVMHQIQTSLLQTATKLMMRFGMTPTLSSVAGGVLPQSLRSGNSAINPLGNMMKLATGPTSGDGDLSTSEKSSSSSSSYASRTEKVISNFLQSPLLEGEAKSQVGHLQSEKDVIQLVLKQQLALEKLKEENEKLQQILVEDLKVSPDKFKVNGYSGSGYTTCSDCFECRRRQRKDRRR
ncbi:hypothetical protein L1987_42261 [Smallanthus sonchifolius]|uniref:Uncharacterized protein n=1 Tax=Smallanthus sonchifolius TaxID=185202 RepID=A0ACB9GVY8_9ASTR|nr:hypothetical protein L1987_42261 [Smallanthus sonchifolius]